jgi:hypothetical protein
MLFSASLNTHFVPFTDRKCHLVDVEKKIFQGNYWRENVILAFYKAQSTILKWFAKAFSPYL